MTGYDLVTFKKVADFQSMVRSMNNNEIVNLSFKVPANFRKQFKIAAIDAGITQNELVQRALDLWVSSHKSDIRAMVDLLASDAFYNAHHIAKRYQGMCAKAFEHCPDKSAIDGQSPGV